MQKPLKEKYRSEPGSSRITLRARGSQTDAPISCSVDIGRAIYEAQAHAGVGGPGTAACSGDLLLGALAACAQVTCQMVAEAMGIEAESIEVTVAGEMDLAGTLGISDNVPVGFESIRTSLGEDGLVERLLAGDRRALARVISKIEREDEETAGIIAEIYPETGRALTVGFTGPPGVGKSSIIAKLIELYRQEERRGGGGTVGPPG